MDENEFMEQEDDIEYVEEPMAADFDFTNVNDPLTIDDPVSQDDVQMPSTVNVVSVELETFSKEYTDYALMNRLLFIADVCPPLRADALKMLINYVIKKTQNIPILNAAYQRVESAKAFGNISGIESVPDIDKNWIEITTVKANNRLESLLAEFKRQKDEAVKESIRRSLEDVFHQYVQMGNLPDALKLYTRGMREYCTSPNQIIQMLISWINVTIYAEQWQKLFVLLPQADRAINEIIERENVSSIPSNTFSTTQYSSLQSLQIPARTSKIQKDLILSSKAKILAVYGLAFLQNKNYKAAAEKFMTIDLDVLNYPQLISPSDVAIYALICALATFSRTELKEKVLGSPLFRKSLESEPKLIELLQRFCQSQFGICLDILNDLRDQLLLNIYLAPHISFLYSLIRQSALIQYFDTYLSSEIGQMAIEFRTSVDELESELISLIEKGLLKAKIDSYKKVLYAKFSDNRTEIYERVLNLRKRISQHANAVLLRAALLNHRIHEQK
uniref:PCI domain-containing protein n=1 Tax=Meloidogyne floridensis TaxID=298350 RepID=A0A915NFL2_9BILA